MRKPPEERSPEDLAGVARFKQLTELELPALAVQGRWPIRFDHCFKRVCLDWAFGGVWYEHLPRPAERHLSGEPLRRAVACAEELAAGGVALVRERDAASLQWRGKRPKADPGAS
jgi:hypothetical protein